MQKRMFVIITIFGLLVGLSALSAQTETPTPTNPQLTPTVRPIELICDLDTLLAQQQALTVQLEAFEAEASGNPGLALDNLFKVGAAYQELALQCGYIPADAAQRPVGTDVERILTLLAEVYGDPINGQVLYNTEFSCAGCHEGENRVGPATEGTYTRVEETRLSDPALAGYTIEQYLVESIVLPGAYIAPDHQNVMPNDFGERISLQELADLVLYLESQDGPSPE
jgi:mono/diheme cytochrome c family protein